MYNATNDISYMCDVYESELYWKISVPAGLFHLSREASPAAIDVPLFILRRSVEGRRTREVRPVEKVWHRPYVSE